MYSNGYNANNMSQQTKVFIRSVLQNNYINSQLWKKKTQDKRFTPKKPNKNGEKKLVFYDLLIILATFMDFLTVDTATAAGTAARRRWPGRTVRSPAAPCNYRTNKAPPCRANRHRLPVETRI